MIYHLLKSNN